MICLICLRSEHDVFAVTDKTISVKFNGDLVPIKTFDKYVNLYIGDKDKNKRLYEKP